MTLDPLTFALEILNFLVLLWLLKRFLYKPIREAINQRQQDLHQGIKNAEEKQAQADALKKEYENKIALWHREQQQRQQALQHTLSQEKEHAMEKVRKAASAEEQRLNNLMAQDQADHRHKLQQQAVAAAMQLTARMLQRLSGVTLDLLLLNMMVEDLKKLPDEAQQDLREALRQQQGRIHIASAHALTEQQLQPLRETLSNIYGQAVEDLAEVNSEVNKELISGIRVNIGVRVLHANLKDELAFFQFDLNHG